MTTSCRDTDSRRIVERTLGLVMGNHEWSGRRQPTPALSARALGAQRGTRAGAAALANRASLISLWTRPLADAVRWTATPERRARGMPKAVSWNCLECCSFQAGGG